MVVHSLFGRGLSAEASEEALTKAARKNSSNGKKKGKTARHRDSDPLVFDLMVHHAPDSAELIAAIADIESYLYAGLAIRTACARRNRKNSKRCSLVECDGLRKTWQKTEESASCSWLVVPDSSAYFAK